MSWLQAHTSPERQILILEEAGSTNEEALRLAREGAAHGAAVVAKRQTRGRGRQGRVWESLEGNLHLSIIVRPVDVQPERLPQLSFVAALACRDALDEAGVPAVQFKWPNDLLLKGRKFGGILLEGASDVVIIGIGLNVADYPAETMFPATALKLEGFEVELDALLHLILPRFDRRYDAWHAKGFEPVREDWLEHAARKGEKVSVRLPEKAIEGTFVDMDDTGALIVHNSEGTHTLLAGDVMFKKG